MKNDQKVLGHVHAVRRVSIPAFIVGLVIVVICIMGDVFPEGMNTVIGSLAGIILAGSLVGIVWSNITFDKVMQVRREQMLSR